MSNYNRRDTNKKSKLSTEITIAFSMYHKNGDKMTTEENDDLIEGDTFVKWVAYSILQDFVGEGELFEPEEVKHGSSTVDNFILVTIPFSGHPDSGFLDVNDAIQHLQESLNLFLRKGTLKFADDVFIKSMNVINKTDYY